MTLSRRLYAIAGLIAVIALAVAAVTMVATNSSAQSTPPTADNQADGETNDDANGVADTSDNHADGETNDDANGVANTADNHADGETADDPVATADAETNDDNGAPADAGNLDDGKDLLPQASITIEQAITAAKTAATGDIGEIDLEDYNGKLVFNVDVGGSDVKVDASNGAVLGSGND